MPAGRVDDGSAGRRPGDEVPGGAEARIRRFRKAASAPFLRLRRMLLHLAWLVGPPEEPVEAVRRPTGDLVDPRVRQTVVANLEGELEGLVDDAAGPGITDLTADALLTIADILAWLRDDAEPPGWAAIDLLEVRVALFNDALGEDEKEMRSAYLNVLLLLLRERVEAIRGSQLRQRRINIESTEESESRRFGAGLEKLRLSHELTVGDLAEGSGLDLVTVIGLLRGARSVNSAEILVLADALRVDPGTLLPERAGAAGRSFSAERGYR